MGDCTYAWRRLSTNWRSSAVIVAMLALGIGVNTAMYTVVRSVLFARPGVQSPERLLYVYAAGRDRRVDFVSFREFVAFRRSQRVFVDAVAATQDRGFLRTGASADDEEVLGEMVSANYFRVLGVHPIVGRAFNAGVDDLAEDEAVVVISEHLWRTRFNADPRAIGEQLTLDSRNYTVIGVAPSSFNGLGEPWRSYDYWVPAVQRSDDYRCNRPDSLRMAMFLVVGRLGEAVSADQAALGVQSLAGRLQREFHPTQADWSLVVRASRHSPLLFFGGGSRVMPSYLVSALFAVTGMVLLVAMTNVCGLLLADGVSRRSEIAIRFALGGSRWRIAREIVVETLWLSSIGGVLALPIASALVATYLSVSGGRIAAHVAGRMSFPIDASSFVFTFALCSAVGLAVGVVAVLQLPRRDLTTCLVGSGTTMPRDVARTLRYAVLTPQVCIAAALLLAAGTFGRAAVRASGLDYGQRLASLVFVNVELPIPGRCERSAAVMKDFTERRHRFARTVLDQAEHSVTLGSLAITNARPFETTRASVTTRSKDARIVRVSRADVSSTYFDTVGIPMLRGRTFDVRDSTTAPRVAVVGEALAHLLWGDENPIGQYVAFSDAESTLPPRWMTVVGVVGEIKTPLGDGERNPTIYVPLEQGTYGRLLVARAGGDFATTIGRVRAMVRDADADVLVVRSGTVKNTLDEILYARRLAAVLLGGCGLSGLLLAGIGLHGAVSYAVAKRTRELGVRVALGATRREIVQLVMRDSVAAATLGLGGSVMIALAFVRVLSATIWPIHDSGPAVAAGVLLTLLTIVLIACYVPARRVTRIDPVEVLREL